MYKIKINDAHQFEVENDFINGKEESFDIIKVKNGAFHIIHNKQSFNATVLDSNKIDKTFTIRINQNEYSIAVQDKFDILLQQLGLGNLKNKKIHHIKAPMPGLVLRIDKKIGDSITKGESVLILEAMKMENMIKSPENAIIKNSVCSKWR